jgi:shikimate dehydrogenase
MKKYCLIGEKLVHSYSAQIHKEFGYSYQLLELEKDQLKTFVEKREFDGFNITIPYKKEIIKYLNYVDPIAKELGAVNTVKYEMGKSYGYNTDIYGMEYVLESKGICLENKKVIILGTGGTSNTACALAKMKKAKEIIVVSRQGKINYQNLSDHFDAQVIINTTPVGMYPNNGEHLVDLNNFTFLESVFDAIYNPLLTPFLFQAREKKIRYASGLKMLVAQAKFARDIFENDTRCNAIIEKIYKKLYYETINIVLIGMPSSGKTTIGKRLAQIFGKKFVDTDYEIEKTFSKSITEIFEQDGEDAFRAMESKVIRSVGKEKNQVISTGGGSVCGLTAYFDLKQNGIIIFLTRDMEKTKTEGRPLLKENAMDTIKKLYPKRLPIYNKFADIVVDNNGTIEDTVDLIKEKIYENIGD